MKFQVLSILLFFWLCFLAGCRAHLDTSRQESRRQTDVIGVELRRVDSLWSSLAERLTYRIEFYPQDYDIGSVGTGNPATGNGGSLQYPASPTDPATASHLLFPNGGGVGSVKSIEISTESEASTKTASRIDSTYNEHNDTSETLQKETASETRHDNGTVAILAVVAGLVVLAIACLLIKKYLKR